jgi:hypothetical protein
MIIHKSFSKTDLIDVINHLDLKVVHSHQDNKHSIQEKITECLKGSIDIKKDNFYNIDNKDGLITFLKSTNPKKTLSVKEKKNVMTIAKHMIQHYKNDYNIALSKYENYRDMKDDMDFIKQFGDIPSVRRACNLMNQDKYFISEGVKFEPYISPQVKIELDEKKTTKITYKGCLTIRRSTPEDPIIIHFD